MKRLITLCLVVILMFCLSGCNYIFGDTNNILKAPTPQGEFEDIGKAIKAANIVGNYTLKSARRGNYRSSFIIRDINLDGTDEAIAFFSSDSKNSEELHMVMLHSLKNEWEIMSDTVLHGTDIEKVEFGDFNLDGAHELAIATNIYGSPELRLSLYNISSTIPVQIYEDAYTDFAIMDIDENGKDDLMLIKLDTSGKTAVCKMLSFVDGSIKQVSSVDINTSISEIEKISVSTIDRKPAMFIDAKTTQNTYFTDLVYFGGKTLIAPISKELLTTRYENTVCSDIDGDAELEIPTSTVLPGDSKNALSLTEWYKYKGGKFESRERSVVSKSLAYRLKINDKWLGKFTCLSSDFDGIDFYEYDGKLKKKLFSIKAVNKEKLDESFDDWSVIDTSGELVYITKVHSKQKLGITKNDIDKNTIISKREGVN